MEMTAVWLTVDEECFVHALKDAGERLESIENEVVLDFSAVRRIDSSALTVMEEFVGVAEVNNVRVVLRGVSVEIYKVLKLVNLATRFSFSNEQSQLLGN